MMRTRRDSWIVVVTCMVSGLARRAAQRAGSRGWGASPSTAVRPPGCRAVARTAAPDRLGGAAVRQRARGGACGTGGARRLGRRCAGSSGGTAGAPGGAGGSAVAGGRRRRRDVRWRRWQRAVRRADVGSGWPGRRIGRRRHGGSRRSRWRRGKRGRSRRNGGARWRGRHRRHGRQRRHDGRRRHGRRDVVAVQRRDARGRNVLRRRDRGPRQQRRRHAGDRLADADQGERDDLPGRQRDLLQGRRRLDRCARAQGLGLGGRADRRRSVRNRREAAHRRGRERSAAAAAAQPAVLGDQQPRADERQGRARRLPRHRRARARRRQADPHLHPQLLRPRRHRRRQLDRRRHRRRRSALGEVPDRAGTPPNARAASSSRSNPPTAPRPGSTTS